MTVRVRPRQSEGRARRRREDLRAHALRRSGEQNLGGGEQNLGGGEHRPRERGPLQDHAVYSCHCGYVFEAAVSTTVGCPNCGGEQAW
jgi:rubrerythrin